MRELVGGGFLVLHGFVHLWYVVLSQGWVEAEEQMGWNGHSWLLSSHLSTETILSIASVLYIVAALGFVAGGVGYILDQDWAGTVLVATAVLSTGVLVVMWDGKPDLLVEKGILGVLINLGIVYWLVLR